MRERGESWGLGNRGNKEEIRRERLKERAARRDSKKTEVGIHKGLSCGE